MLNGLVFSVGGVPLFTSRIFPTTFILALAARWIQPTQFVAFPSWLMSDLALLVLFVFAAAEIYANKVPEIAELLQTFDREIKVAAYFVYSGIVMRSGTIALAEQPETLAMGWVPSPGWIIAGLLSTAVWFFAGVRNRLMSVLIDADDDDSLGARGFISWIEDAWVVIGAMLLIVMPVLALMVSGLALFGAFLLQKKLDEREKRLMVPCASCGDPTHAAALACPSCKTATATPKRVNFFGMPTEEPVGDRHEHRLILISKRRCLVCASKLPKRAIQQQCPSCGTLALPSEPWFEAYLTYANQGLWKTLGVCFCFGLVPVFGLIPGVIYYRFGLISNLRRYVPATVGCATRWGVRIINIFLLMLQGVPLLGALALPAMCLTNYYVYRAVLRHEGNRCFGQQQQVSMRPELSTSTL